MSSKLKIKDAPKIVEELCEKLIAKEKLTATVNLELRKELHDFLNSLLENVPKEGITLKDRNDITNFLVDLGVKDSLQSNDSLNFEVAVIGAELLKNWPAVLVAVTAIAIAAGAFDVEIRKDLEVDPDGRRREHFRIGKCRNP